MKIIFKDVKVINPEQNINYKTNILLTDGIITAVGEIKEEDYKTSTVYDMSGKIITPGFFDMHVHLREPGREDEETIKTGSEAAMAGGFTGIACMPNTIPAIDSAEVVNFVISKSKNLLVDVYPIGAVTKDRKGENLSPVLELIEAGIVGLSDDGSVIKTAAMLKSAFEYALMNDIPVIDHCEDCSFLDGVMNEGVTSTMLGLPPLPAASEDIIVVRDIVLAEYTGGKLHIAHISTKNAVSFVRDAKAKGIKVTAEVTPHHFTLTDEVLKSYDTNYKMSPPLRGKEDLKAILEGLKDGTIDCIATDHAPHAIEEKEMEFVYAPNGIVGLETAVGLALSELYHKKILSIEQIIEKFAINPRKILNIDIPKIAIGEMANFTILDTDIIWTVEVSKFKSKSKNSPFNKKLLTGKSIGVVNKQKMFYNDLITNLI
ncbi:MAG: dihydroorotase [bacterium]